VNVLVIAKEPLPGRVKTRLTPPLTASEAAAVAEAALADTLQAADQLPVRRRVLVLDGRPGPWLPSGWHVVPQVGGGLDTRLAAAFGVVPDAPAVLIGMDTPQVCPTQLAAFAPGRYDACLGLSKDGGYWAIGLRRPALAAAVIPGVPMSSVRTGMEQACRLRAAGLRVQLLDVLEDVDTVDAAVRVADLVPTSRFAATVRSVGLPC
jgi:glycosyltransferase A (GT-A) superfamily protein (DUF2064 family)